MNIYRILKLIDPHQFLIQVEANTSTSDFQHLYDINKKQYQLQEIKKVDNNLFQIKLDSIPTSSLLFDKSSIDISFLFCANPLNSREVDYDYFEEYNECNKYFNTYLFNYESLEFEHKLKLSKKSHPQLVVYRGWMLNNELYSILYELLKQEKMILINSPKEYSQYNLIVNWYNDFRLDTARTVWNHSNKINDALLCLKSFDSSVIIKDYVKSRKHEWNDACFISNPQDLNQATKVITNFIERQGVNFNGGIVIRDFLQLKQIGYHKKSLMPIFEEYRAFIFHHQIIAIDHYWENDNLLVFSKNDYHWLYQQIKKINSNFVTIDFARTIDGTLVIIELGDGQVSGLQQIEPSAFYFNFKKSMEV